MVHGVITIRYPVRTMRPDKGAVPKGLSYWPTRITTRWRRLVDFICLRLLKPKRCGRSIVLEGPNEVVIEKSIHFSFKTSNNQAE